MYVRSLCNKQIIICWWAKELI